MGTNIPSSPQSRHDVSLASLPRAAGAVVSIQLTLRIKAMSKLSQLTLHASALAILVGGMAITAPSYAASSSTQPSAIVISDDSASPDSDSAMTAAPAKKGKMMHQAKMSPEMMQEHVENRIKTLHTKLMITPDQESAWNDVAQAMRDNEK